ncbi:MAG: MBL fold metallo-hydrolase, partial [Candidatus Nealsonbacteria bacterium]|nr:MBL fold metallo-hydrolase [Candidatus Nealsonbacteria bacterium]
MNLIIHRGTHEIGGSCVELITATNRILIDFGIPLVSRDHQPFDVNQLKGKSLQELREKKILPDIKGLYKDEEKGIDGILISHSHLDHYGFLQYVNPEIPIYLSQGAGILIDVSNIFVPTKVGKINTNIISNKKRFRIGDFTVQPFLVDHSAFDAFAFMIEAEGKRLFYSGDFRAHGRKAKLFKQIIERPPQNIDCLLMEGSALGREDVQYKTEGDVEKRLEEILRERKNITFLFASSQNIDRIVSAYRACLKTDSIFVIDIYTAFILDKLKKVSDRIPQFNWKNIRVKFLNTHAKTLEKAGHIDLLYTYNKRKIKMPEISRDKNRILMLARDNSVFPLLLNKIKDVAGAKIAYSMWDGYLSEGFRAFCKSKVLTLEYIHTSGHANLEDLKTFASAMNPIMLIPIHTFE